MPYIKQTERELLQPQCYTTPDNAGQLNYVLTMICKQYWEERGRYAAINDIVGALECCKMEFYSRVARPYETEKCEANGDVYTDSYKRLPDPCDVAVLRTDPRVFALD